MEPAGTQLDKSQACCHLQTTKQQCLPKAVQGIGDSVFTLSANCVYVHFHSQSPGRWPGLSGRGSALGLCGLCCSEGASTGGVGNPALCTKMMVLCIPPAGSCPQVGSPNSIGGIIITSDVTAALFHSIGTPLTTKSTSVVSASLAISHTLKRTSSTYNILPSDSNNVFTLDFFCHTPALT